MKRWLFVVPVLALVAMMALPRHVRADSVSSFVRAGQYPDMAAYYLNVNSTSTHIGATGGPPGMSGVEAYSPNASTTDNVHAGNTTSSGFGTFSLSINLSSGNLSPTQTMPDFTISGSLWDQSNMETQSATTLLSGNVIAFATPSQTGGGYIFIVQNTGGGALNSVYGTYDEVQITNIGSRSSPDWKSDVFAACMVVPEPNKWMSFSFLLPFGIFLFVRHRWGRRVGFVSGPRSQ